MIDFKDASESCMNRNCGEMAAGHEGISSKYPSGNVCGSASSIIYAWALDAQKMDLPKGK